ncbi:MAG: FtsW/RodA/SpoVE family cell cycle protein, partial [candidate division WOR-3 bacterium]|nr:FtsW/RodA/SpoVE family cell cycle protein [candidate division WOR-3 bacterium]
LVMVYSVTIQFGFSYLKAQLIRILVGFIALLVASFIPYHYYKKKIKDILLMLAILVLIFTLVTGKKVSGAKRWTKAKWLSVQFQPGEVAKYILVFWLAGYFANRQSEEEEKKRKMFSYNCLSANDISTIRKTEHSLNDKIVGLIRNYLKSNFFPFTVVGLMVLLLLLQPAIGTSVIVIFSALLIFLISGVKPKYILLTIFFGIIVLWISVTFIPHAKIRYEKFKQGPTYQQIQSVIAIGSGGLLGKGLGEGKQKYYFLPKLHTDFMFSAIGEEFGFVGSILILGLFFVLLNRGLKIAVEINDTFGGLLVAGIMIMIFHYVIVHLGVVLALLPVTGQPFPFISYGGSALISNLYAIGVVLNVSKFCRQSIDENINFKSMRAGWRNRRIGINRSNKRWRL